MLDSMTVVYIYYHYWRGGSSAHVSNKDYQCSSSVTIKWSTQFMDDRI